jgi:hypothetical protein
MDTASPSAAVRCRHCRRPLKSLASVLAGIGPRCAAIEAALGDLTPEQQDKALELIEDGAILPVRNGTYEAVSADGTETHRVHAVTGNCTCPAGIKRVSADAKPCYHAGAARLLARPAVRWVLRRSQFVKAS